MSAEIKLEPCFNPECSSAGPGPKGFEDEPKLWIDGFHGGPYWAECRCCDMRGPQAKTPAEAARLWSLLALPRPSGASDVLLTATRDILSAATHAVSARERCQEPGSGRTLVRDEFMWRLDSCCVALRAALAVAPTPSTMRRILDRIATAIDAHPAFGGKADANLAAAAVMGALGEASELYHKRPPQLSDAERLRRQGSTVRERMGGPPAPPAESALREAVEDWFKLCTKDAEDGWGYLLNEEVSEILDRMHAALVACRKGK